MLCICSRGVNHGLLMLWSKEFQTFRLTELHYALAKTRNISMAKDCPNPIDESVFATISFDELVRHKSNNSLPGG